MSDQDQRLPPHYVPTLTEVVIAPDQPAASPPIGTPAVRQPVANGPVSPPPDDAMMEEWLDGLQEDLTQYLTARCQEQVPQWVAQWVRDMAPELKALAQKIAARAVVVPGEKPSSDRDKP